MISPGRACPVEQVRPFGFPNGGLTASRATSPKTLLNASSRKLLQLRTNTFGVNCNIAPSSQRDVSHAGKALDLHGGPQCNVAREPQLSAFAFSPPPATPPHVVTTDRRLFPGHWLRGLRVGPGAF